MQVQAYLNFNGRCEEAIEFYRKALGAQVQAMMRWSDMPAPPAGSAPADGCPGGNMTPPPADKVMHAELRIGESVVMASDGRLDGQPVRFDGISLTLSPPNDAEAERLFKALAAGGQVQMPLGPTFFASSFGIVADRFGVPWMIVVDAAGK